METNQQILQRKLKPPLIQKSVHRERLLNEVSRSLETEKGFYRKLTLLAAPAGYGKTYLMVNLYKKVEKQGENCCWLTFSKEDDSVSRLLLYLAVTLSSHPEIELNPEQYQIEQEGFSTEKNKALCKNILTDFLNKLEQLEAPFYIFFDELEHIESPEVCELLEYFISHLPPTVHIIASSRIDLPGR